MISSRSAWLGAIRPVFARSSGGRFSPREVVGLQLGHVVARLLERSLDIDRVMIAAMTAPTTGQTEADSPVGVLAPDIELDGKVFVRGFARVAQSGPRVTLGAVGRATCVIRDQSSRLAEPSAR